MRWEVCGTFIAIFRWFFLAICWALLPQEAQRCPPTSFFTGPERAQRPLALKLWLSSNFSFLFRVWLVNRAQVFKHYTQKLQNPDFPKNFTHPLEYGCFNFSGTKKRPPFFPPGRPTIIFLNKKCSLLLRGGVREKGRRRGGEGMVRGAGCSRL